MNRGAGHWRSLGDLAQHLVLRQDWLPLREAARLYRVTPETMQIWLRGGHFHACQIHSKLWISRAELEAGLRRRPGHSAAERGRDRPYDGAA
jgi:hypothetical protein